MWFFSLLAEWKKSPFNCITRHDEVREKERRAEDESRDEIEMMFFYFGGDTTGEDDDNDEEEEAETIMRAVIINFPLQLLISLKLLFGEQSFTV